jgi:hypothetical protein
VLHVTGDPAGPMTGVLCLGVEPTARRSAIEIASGK